MRAFPLPESATEQPLIAVPLSVNETVPLGATPLTVAVNVTLVPWVDGLSELAMLVVLAALLTVCDKAELADAALAVSPE